MKYNIVVTSAGSAGGENLIRSIRKSKLDITIFGTNMNESLLLKSASDYLAWLPNAKDNDYISKLTNIIKYNNINLVIPNSDLEVERISLDRDKIPCSVFLPPHNTIEVCQDKFVMYNTLENADIPVAKTVAIKDYNNIKTFMLNYPREKYWIRTRKGAGSIAATWVVNYEQAISWIKLWIELRNFNITDFTISEFLPGRDYAFQSVWYNGQLKVAKMAERLEYYMGNHRLSGMSSTPSVAKTIRDEKALDTIFKAIKTITPQPHGNYNLDLKGNKNNLMFITEFNIGRFMNITPIHDLTGKYNTADIFLKCALGLNVNTSDPIDIEEGKYLIRELDTEPVIISESEYHNKITNAKKMSAN